MRLESGWLAASTQQQAPPSELLQRAFQLRQVEPTTPWQHVMTLAERGNLEEALEAARELQLDADAVVERCWSRVARAPCSASDIRRFLEPH